MKKIAFLLILIIVAFAGVTFGRQIIGQDSSTKDQQVLVANSNQEVKGATEIPVVTDTTNSTAALPKTIRIPKINVNGTVESVGLDSKKAMDVPKDADNAGWYNKGTRPGQIGNAVLAGHLDKEDGSPAIFYKLTSLQKGDKIYIIDEAGVEHTYEVIRMAKYPHDAFPIGEVFGKTDKAMLNLITCQGDWSESAKNYSHRYVIYSQLVD